MNASPEIAATFKAWSLAELASHYAEGCPDEVMDRLTGEAMALPKALAALPAASADDLLLKVFPLLMASYEAHGSRPPLLPHYDYMGNGSEELLSAVTEDMRRLCPEIAEAMAVPHRDAFRQKGDVCGPRPADEHATGEA
jgi:hypothetical protein